MYDDLSSDYDRFINWQSRLSIELPFMIEKLHSANVKSVLDAATGTGMHAIALTQCGFVASGADISQGMIARARANAKSAGVKVRFEIAGFGTLANTFDAHSFDALLCLGNSLPHLLSLSELSQALHDFSACLHPGGLLLLQNRNFDAIVNQHDRWMDPQSHSEGDTDWIFLRFYDFDPDGLLTFNMLTLKRINQGRWTQRITSARLRPLFKEELVSCLLETGFSDLELYGDMTGSPFEPSNSPNLVILAKAPV